MNQPDKPRYALVTVGTTSFDALIAVVTSKSFLDVLWRVHGIGRLVVQVGRGAIAPEDIATAPSDSHAAAEATSKQEEQPSLSSSSSSQRRVTRSQATSVNGGSAASDSARGTSHDHDRVQIEAYRFKPSLSKDMEHAELIIAHGGAGTILEALRADRKLIVVINEDLLGNHQHELAGQLSANGHLLQTSVKQETRTHRCNCKSRSTKATPARKPSAIC
ncbi:hypothetical protein CAOG_005945 [Capsaspora owczarzaki ATCC 30864]|uniref:UDP-N-acetylglucosamine transferase subunit ALG13 n=1 Tax=Capsaspora owczarzaki (strain ATCC 30864) TaxID=595528 RepID=A0A0D2UK63_CAPO3|nr:hypothetical protein CAOG_005945 [Capsaspora owczarzaki ATCC 30864]